MNKSDVLPDFCFNRITDINVDDVKCMGVKALAIDLDNTTVKDASYHVSDRVKQWVKKMKNNGIPVVIVSNTFIFRAHWISCKMGRLPFVPLANKPKTFALKAAAKLVKTDIHSVALIGDQLFTDVLCANRAGAVSVKVEPMGADKHFTSKYRIRREKEREYLSDFRKNNPTASVI